MIPNDPSTENEEIRSEAQDSPAVEGGEQTPEVEAQDTVAETPAVIGDQENEALPAEIETAIVIESEVEVAPEVPETPVSAESTDDPIVAEVDADEADEHVDEFPDVEDALPAVEEPSEDEQDAIFDNTGDSAESLLSEIMGDHTNFDATVEKATPSELVLLMETISVRGKVSEFAQKVMTIRKSFDKKVDPETAEANISSRFQTAFSIFNKKRSAYYADREKEKEENSTKKRELLEQLKTIVAEEQVQKIQEVRELQTQWRAIGWVAQKDLQALSETYRQYLDIFYNLRSKYQELLDYDRKVNMDEKKKAIEEIESMIPTEEGITREEWTARSAKVKSIQEVWRTIGLVPRESLEEINSAYRNVLERFYELRSSYFELQDQQKGENSAAKKALLERLQPYLDYTADKAKTWNEATRKVLALQEEWKKIGPGPLEENKQLWKDYRHICDTFFNRKGEYFKGFDGQRSDNLHLKTVICEKAEAVLESTDWKEGAKVLKELQEEWKKVGPVHERHSNKVWKRFRKACDSFFERRSAASSSEKNQLDDNLKAKEALIARLEALVAEEGGSSETFQEIQTEWKATGHVPFKQKDKINNAFKELIGKYFEKNRGANRDRSAYQGERSSNYQGKRQDQGRRKDDENNAPLEGDERSRRLQGELRKLRIRVQEIEGKVSQYELNIQYIAKGKSGDGLRTMIQGQIDAEKAKGKELRAKIKEFQKMLDNPPAVAAEEVVEAIASPEVEAPENAETTEEAPAPNEEV